MIFAFSAAPLARAMTASFVLISPSILIQLKLCRTAMPRARLSKAGAIAASLVINASIVACRAPVRVIFGSIIPAPLQIPPIRTGDFPILNSTATSFRRVSLVMIASAVARAFWLELASNGAQALIPRVTFSIGIEMPIRPVEQTSTSFLLR